jgi:superfamily I DNA/RNA helicase
MLDSDQQAAVDTREGAHVIISGPGSGKTRVIAERFKAMLYGGISPDHILTLTFTEQAAKNMGERAGFGMTQSVFRTFHSYCLSVLKKERGCLPFELRPDIIGLQPDIFEVVCEIIDSLQRRLTYREIVDAIGEYKRNGISPEQATAEAAGLDLFSAMAYREYDKKSKERGWLDFDSLIIETVKLMEANPGVLERNQVRFVQVDEAQDTDSNQFRLLKLITNQHKNIFVVGDENQLIYEWRSAMPGSLSNFYKHFAGANTLYLGTNYRSSQTIVGFLKKIVPVDNGLASRMHPGPSNPEGYPPTFTKYRDEDQEMDKVLSSAITDVENTAILARTNRQLWKFENTCMRRGIKYRLLGKTGFWEQEEIKKLVDLIKLKKNAHGSAGPIVKQIIDDSGLVKRYRMPVKFGQKDPQENINEAYKISTRFDSIDAFLKHANKAYHAYKNRTGLILSTIHQIKGKEAKRVFVIGTCQGLLPHEQGEISEESRIFFVAASRAEQELHFSYYGQPSMFITPFLKEEAKSLQDFTKQIPGTQHALFEEIV